jgi:large subunit ribosomal protein L32
MAVPRNRTSNARKNSKRAHHAKKPKSASGCSHCGAARLPHRVCSSCGYYDGRAVTKIEEAKD